MVRIKLIVSHGILKDGLKYNAMDMEGVAMKRNVTTLTLFLLLTACNFPASSITAEPTGSPVPSAISLPTSIPGPNEYITVAQLNLWFHGPGCYGGFEAFDCSGKRNTTLTPLLGQTYDSASADVIRQ